MEVFILIKTMWTFPIGRQSKLELSNWNFDLFWSLLSIQPVGIVIVQIMPNLFSHTINICAKQWVLHFFRTISLKKFYVTEERKKKSDNLFKKILIWFLHIHHHHHHHSFGKSTENYDYILSVELINFLSFFFCAKFHSCMTKVHSFECDVVQVNVVDRLCQFPSELLLVIANLSIKRQNQPKTHKPHTKKHTHSKKFILCSAYDLISSRYLPYFSFILSLSLWSCFAILFFYCGVVQKLSA